MLSKRATEETHEDSLILMCHNIFNDENIEDLNKALKRVER